MNWHVLIHKAPPKKRRFFYGFSSLFGKAPVCGTGEQGSIPGDTQKMWMVNSEFLKLTAERIDHSQKINNLIAQLDRALVYETKCEGSNPSGITKNRRIYAIINNFA